MHVLHISISLPRWNSPTSGIYNIRLADCQASHSGFDQANVFGISLRRIQAILYRLMTLKKPALLKSQSSDNVITKHKLKLRKYDKRHGRGSIEYAKCVTDYFDQYIDENGRPDLIHAHSGRGAGLAAAFIKMVYGIPYVVTEHHPAFLGEQTGYDISSDIGQLRFVYNESSDIFIQSDGMTKGINKVGEFDTTIFPHVIADPFVKTVSTEYENQTYILSVGRLNKNRNQQLAIKALARYHDTFNKDCLLRIVGTGKSQAKYKKEAVKLGVGKSVEFLGYLDQNDLQKQYSSAQATVVCSNFETFCLPIIESLACGTPVISTRTSGPMSIANRVDQGIVFSEYDPTDMARRFDEMITTDFDPVNLHNAVMDQYSPEVVAEFSLEKYRDAIKRA